jgi:soluble lytic murein transglycosylase
MTIQMKSLFLFLPFVFAATAHADVIEDFRKTQLKADKVETILPFEKKISTLVPSEKGILHFGLGMKFFELGDDEKAQANLSEAIRLGFAATEPASLYLGKSFARSGKKEGAKLEFSKIVQKKPASYLKEEAQLELAKILLEEKKYKEANLALSYLERRARSSFSYPEVLWNLIRINVESGSVAKSCVWVRKLYSRKPNFSKIQHWTLDSSSLTYEKTKLPCPVSQADQKRRLQNLVLTGLSDKAKIELDQYVEKFSKVSKYQTDLLLSHYYILEGYTVEAFQILAPYYTGFQNNYDYLLLLAKAAVRSGEFQTAVGAYYKAHKLRKNSKSGRFALYQAAFLSYQFQDYDGAGRKFEEFIDIYSKSGLAKDAYWHQAWIRYLKKDYKGALAAFDGLKRFRGMNKQDRVIYWKAMTFYHLNDNKNAEKLFQVLINPKAPSFYSIAALQRLKKLNARPDARVIASAETAVEETVADKTDEGVVVAAESEAQETEESVDKIDEVADSEQEASEDEPTALSSKEEASVEGMIATGVDVLKSGDTKTATEFSNSTANRYYFRANDLIRLGYNDLARWELYNTEKSTRNPVELRKLMETYKKIEAYNRISHIASNVFAKDRYKYGMSIAKDLWQAAFPEAYKSAVQPAAKANEVDPHFVWSIMRAESNFKVDAKSPVGALGLMQLMPYTAERVAAQQNVPYNVDDLILPARNLQFGTAYLAKLYHMFSSQLPLAAAGYNAGPHRVKSWVKSFGNLDMDEFIEHIPFVETRNYVKKVTQNYFIYSQLYSSGEPQVAWLSEPLSYKFEGRAPTREEW